MCHNIYLGMSTYTEWLMITYSLNIITTFRTIKVSWKWGETWGRGEMWLLRKRWKKCTSYKTCWILILASDFFWGSILFNDAAILSPKSIFTAFLRQILHTAKLAKDLCNNCIGCIPLAPLALFSPDGIKK